MPFQPFLSLSSPHVSPNQTFSQQYITVCLNAPQSTTGPKDCRVDSPKTRIMLYSMVGGVVCSCGCDTCDTTCTTCRCDQSIHHLRKRRKQFSDPAKLCRVGTKRPPTSSIHRPILEPPPEGRKNNDLSWCRCFFVISGRADDERA